MPRYFFEFHADAYGDARQSSGFRASYGYEKGAQLISRETVTPSSPTGCRPCSYLYYSSRPQSYIELRRGGVSLYIGT